jgi:hypothetical protein
MPHTAAVSDGDLLVVTSGQVSGAAFDRLQAAHAVVVESHPAWAQGYLPEHAGLVGRALEWHEADDDSGVEYEVTYRETDAFVHRMMDLIRNGQE